jgi:uncharacterized protein
MVKIFLFAALAFVAYLALSARRSRRQNRTNATKGPADRAEAIVACNRCGVHFPASESLTKDGRHYCSEEHRRLG